jgi:hypothetical protein
MLPNLRHERRRVSTRFDGRDEPSDALLDVALLGV